MKRRADSFDDFFPGAMEDGLLVPFMHRGAWAIHTALSLFLEKAGPSDVSLMTFNISEDSIRSIFFEDRIRSLRMLLDLGIKRNKIDLLLFLSSVAPDIRLDRTHAKLLLIHNDLYDFGIMGSANLNQVSRLESGIWFTRGPVFDYFQTQFDTLYENALPYDATKD